MLFPNFIICVFRTKYKKKYENPFSACQFRDFTIFIASLTPLLKFKLPPDWYLYTT